MHTAIMFVLSITFISSLFVMLNDNKSSSQIEAAFIVLVISTLGLILGLIETDLVKNLIQSYKNLK